MRRILATFAVLSLSCLAAQAQTGPVATACKDDLAKLCAGKNHASREARTCLEASKAQVTDACKKALDTTGPGKGQGKGKSAS